MADINLLKVEPNLNISLSRQKRIGILNRGKNNTFINNSFEGLDVAIQDEGENTFASGNKVE